MPSLCVAIPLLVAALLAITHPHLPRKAIDAVTIATTTSVAVLCAWLLREARQGTIVYWFGGWKPHDGVALGISFVIDPLGAGLALLTSLLATASAVFCWRYFKQVGGLFSALFLVFVGAMLGFCLTGDLFNMFVFFELMGVAAYALTAYKIEEQPALMGAFNFAVTNSVGAFLVLLGIGLLYSRTGALNIAQIGRTIADAGADGSVLVALALVASGFAIKAALVPFHFWLADAHAVAPAPICVLFSGVMVELGLYAIVRLFWAMFAPVLADRLWLVRDVAVGIGVLTMLLGGVMCFAERHLKRLLAFSTISHMGMFVLASGLLVPLGLAGAAYYVLAHGLVKAGLFLGAGVLLNRFASADENQLHGRGRRFPVLGLVLAAGGLALAGVPPFGIFRGKALIEHASETAGYGWVVWPMLAASALTGGAVLRVTGHVFLGLGTFQNPGADSPSIEETELEEKYNRVPLVMFAPSAVLVLLSYLVVLWPGLGDELHLAAQRFQDSEGYQAVALDETTGVRPPRSSGTRSEPIGNASALATGTASSVGAIVLALIALFKHCFPLWVRKATTRVGCPPLKVLRTLHSGNVQDYVVWICVGVAVFGGLLATWGRPT